MRFLLLIGVLFLSACSSMVTSSMAFVVAKHAEIQSKKDIQFTALDRCLTDEAPVAYEMAMLSLQGKPIPQVYQSMLVLGKETKVEQPFPPEQLAYAFAIIASRMKDTRAEELKASIKPRLTPEDIAHIEEHMAFKYLDSYFEKCFFVPDTFQKRIGLRDFILRKG